MPEVPKLETNEYVGNWKGANRHCKLKPSVHSQSWKLLVKRFQQII